MFTSEVPDYAGRRVKEADKDIIAALKGKGRLFKQDTINHSYPFCERSDTPLIYRAVSSWYVAVEKIRDRGTRWVITGPS
jgi:isoleucyl-tRNA synthetase